jgi:hypothetical protein
MRPVFLHTFLEDSILAAIRQQKPIFTKICLHFICEYANIPMIYKSREWDVLYRIKRFQRERAGVSRLRGIQGLLPGAAA